LLSVIICFRIIFAEKSDRGKSFPVYGFFLALLPKKAVEICLIRIRYFTKDIIVIIYKDLRGNTSGILSNRRIFTKNGFLCKKTIDEIKF
jgi:hypothetical protein